MTKLALGMTLVLATFFAAIVPASAITVGELNQSDNITNASYVTGAIDMYITVLTVSGQQAKAQCVGQWYSGDGPGPTQLANFFNDPQYANVDAPNLIMVLENRYAEECVKAG